MTAPRFPVGHHIRITARPTCSGPCFRVTIRQGSSENDGRLSPVSNTQTTGRGPVSSPSLVGTRTNEVGLHELNGRDIDAHLQYPLMRLLVALSERLARLVEDPQVPIFTMSPVSSAIGMKSSARSGSNGVLGEASTR